MSNLLQIIEELKAMYKHQPGRHPQKSHAGGRGGGSGSSEVAWPSQPPGAKKPAFGQYVEKKVAGEGTVEKLTIDGTDFQVRQGKTWQQLDAKQLWDRTYYDAAVKKGDSWQIMGTVTRSVAGYGTEHWKHSKQKGKDYPTMRAALDDMQFYH